MATTAVVKLQGEQGMAFARIAMAIAATKGTGMNAAEYARNRWPSSPSVAAAITEKTAVAGGTVGGWGGDLVWADLASDYLAAVRAATVLDRAPFRRAPLLTAIPREATAATVGGWSGNGQPLPVSALNTASTVLQGYRSGAISVITKELAKSSRPGADRVVRDLLVISLARFLDRQLLDPTVALVVGQTPASIANGATEVVSTGATAAQKIADLQNMIAAIGEDMESPLWVMTRRDAVMLATTLTTGGSYAFPNIHARGGNLLGIDVMISASTPSALGSPATDRTITLVDCAQILVAEGSGADVSVSSIATLEMDSEPTNEGGATPVGSSQVSTFQTESIAIKTVREVSWLRARTDAVSYMEVSY